MASSSEAVWIERFDPPAGPGPLVAVKDLFDVAGSVTTAGCRAVAARGVVAGTDAACIARVREAGGRLAGKVNLHELAFGVTGVNPWYGTPQNPVAPGRIPGGSSSGSAVAVATGEVEVGLGSDTGGSVRIPAACCAVVGLKTTHGRIPLEGVWPLAPSFDTVGPLGANAAATLTGMRLLEPGFELESDPPLEIGRAVLGPEVAIDEAVDEAVDRALFSAELVTRPVVVEGWHDAWRHQQLLLGDEAVASDGFLLEAGADSIGPETRERLRRSVQPAAAVRAASDAGRAFCSHFVRLVEACGALALPTLARRPPLVGDPVQGFNLLVAPVNLAGLPALSVPVPVRGRPPAGLQLVGPPGSEGRLLALGARIEAAVAR